MPSGSRPSNAAGRLIVQWSRQAVMMAAMASSTVASAASTIGAAFVQRGGSCSKAAFAGAGRAKRRRRSLSAAPRDTIAAATSDGPRSFTCVGMTCLVSGALFPARRWLPRARQPFLRRPNLANNASQRSGFLQRRAGHNSDNDLKCFAEHPAANAWHEKSYPQKYPQATGAMRRHSATFGITAARAAIAVFLAQQGIGAALGAGAKTPRRAVACSILEVHDLGVGLALGPKLRLGGQESGLDHVALDHVADGG